MGDFESKAFWKNKYKICCLIPIYPKLETGQHTLGIEVSINGSQFVNTGMEILMNFDKQILNMDTKTQFPEIMKMDGGSKLTKKK